MKILTIKENNVPTCWTNYLGFIQEKHNTTDIPQDIINEDFKKYNAKIRWGESLAIHFDSEKDRSWFIMKWSEN